MYVMYMYVLVYIYLCAKYKVCQYRVHRTAYICTQVCEYDTFALYSWALVLVHIV